ncbi:SRSF protein kinase 2-like protein [Willisornis vidua]|uniref:non-specific serine/threonine protein kinase n=1 Tax=Willisornis vidua TaxID=1566151 RepID=A0ABQ9CQS1_9PASS|nr:SRSF protein kinase 2-like protein [Willisornis vidua]
MEEQVQEEMLPAQHTGGHHPVQEGEVFNTRYQALHELGCGAFATVWLCQDVRPILFPSSQVLAGLHFLHKRCHIIHADIKPENILLYGHDKNLQRLLMDTLDCGQRTHVKLKGVGDHLGNQLEESDLMSLEVKIADLGSACWTAFEMATGECLFDPQPGKYFSRDDDHVARIIELLGRIPPQIAFSWNKSTKFFSRPGALLRLSRLSPRSLPGTLADRHGWTPRAAAAFATFLLPALHYAPERRASAAQSLRHAWIAAP